MPDTAITDAHPQGGVPIILKDLTKKYPNQPKAAVDSVNLEIPAGEIVVFVGPSGCGKTTTMRMINRLIEPTSRHDHGSAARTSPSSTTCSCAARSATSSSRSA